MIDIVNPSLLFLSETILSLYPIIVKKSNLELFWQVIIRLLVYSIIPIFFINIPILIGKVPLAYWIVAAGVTMVHIWSSYRGFQLLDPGFAMTIFYLYPIFNLILLALFTGYRIPIWKYLTFAIPMYIVYSIYVERLDLSKVEIPIKGVAITLIAALTESMMYVILRALGLGANPFESSFVLYSGAFLLALPLMIGKIGIGGLPNLWESNKVLGMNIFIGLVGYLLRFYTVDKIDPFIFAILSYTGVLTSHYFGWYFTDEVISPKNIILLIGFIISMLFVNRTEV